MKTLRAFLTATAALIAGGFVQATPPSDPICGAPNSLDRVLEVRARRVSELGLRRGNVRRLGADTPPRFWLDRSDTPALPRLGLEGTPGQSYEIERTPDLTLPRWEPWLSVIPGNQALTWEATDPDESTAGFFRVQWNGPDPFAEPVSNFRLLDAGGVAHDLYYHTHRKAIVVLAAGGELQAIAPLAPLLRELGAAYTNQAEIWILLSDPAPVRTNVLVEAKSLGLDAPVLLDPYHLAAVATGLTRAGEAAVVRTPEFTLAYRGAIAGPDASTADGSLLGQALAGVIKEAPVTFVRTPTPGPLLIQTPVAVPEYSREIAPLLHQHCAKCHRPDGVAPFALTNHSVVAEWAPAIKHAVLSGKMPPWHADPEYGHFANNISLPGPLKSALVRWLDAGAPRGEGADPLAELAPPPAFDRWPEDLGEPDAVVNIPVQPVKASGTEDYRYIFAQTPNKTNVWLRAAVIRPSNYRSVHHYLVWLGRIGNQGVPGVSTYQSHFAEFVPGYEPFRFPPDAGVLLTRSNWVTFNLHYTPYGVATNDQPVLALWYHKTRPAKAWNTQSPGNGDFVIPPGASDHQVQTEMPLTSPITLHRMNPHMHLRGKRVKYEVVYPNGRREVLLSVPDYDFSWQIGYALAEPKLLPAGSRIVVSGAFDNSPQNLANPDPTARVLWGDQSSAEMFVGFMDYTQ